LYNLATHPEYIEPLREEIETQLITGGWNKATISKMRKLDSFLKETFRLYPAGASKPSFEKIVNILAGTQRLVIKPYTFANGITVYPGTTLTSLLEPIHGDKSIYKNPENFDGFRFYRNEDTKSYSTNTSTEFLMFSHGKHAWYNLDKMILIVVPDDFLPSI
jgi:cytochrome P450